MDQTIARRNPRRTTRLYCSSVALLILTAGCGGKDTTTPTTPSPPATAEPAVPPPPPGPPAGTISGAVITAYHGVRVPGATVAVDGIGPVVTDSGGNYSVVVPDAGTRRVVIAADGHQYRETFVRTGETRAVSFDLIPNNGTFPFTLFRQIARNGHEQPNNLQPLKRWTQSPKVHVETVWRDTGAPVDPTALQYIVSEIRRAIPQLTDGHFEAASIELGPERWDFVQDYISVHFDHSGNYGYLGQNPGQVQFGSAAQCTSVMVIHEFGHAMGLWHSSVKPSVMGGMPGDCNLVNLTADEQQVVRVLYNRPVGNVEPDRDPAGAAFYMESVEPAVSGEPVRCDLVLQ